MLNELRLNPDSQIPDIAAFSITGLHELDTLPNIKFIDSALVRLMSFAGELERSIIRLGGFSTLTCFFGELQDLYGLASPQPFLKAPGSIISSQMCTQYKQNTV